MFAVQFNVPAADEVALVQEQETGTCKDDTCEVCLIEDGDLDNLGQPDRLVLETFVKCLRVLVNRRVGGVLRVVEYCADLVMSMQEKVQFSKCRKHVFLYFTKYIGVMTWKDSSQTDIIVLAAYIVADK